MLADAAVSLLDRVEHDRPVRLLGVRLEMVEPEGGYSAMSAGRQDWQEWHRDYDDADSSVSRRLVQVRARSATLLDEAAEPVRLLNLCCGDGRDTVPVLAALRPGGGRLSGRARPGPRRCGTSSGRRGGGPVDVRTGDAAATATYADRLPVDVLLLVGVLGNVSDADAERTIAAHGVDGGARAAR